MTARSLKGSYPGSPTREDAYRIHSLLYRTIVPPSEFWVPLRLDPDAWGKSLHPERLASSLLTGSQIEDGWSAPWERLEAQVGLILANHDIPAAASYAFRLLGVSRPSRRTLCWEGFPGASRLWVRTGAWVTPLPLQSAVEGALWAWWALSGGLHNYAADLIPLPDYPLDIFPHYQEGDREALQTHPSRVVYSLVQWVGVREGETFEDRLGVLYTPDGRPVRETLDGPRPFVWTDEPGMTYGLDWVDEAMPRLGPDLHQVVRAWRTGMQPPR